MRENKIKHQMMCCISNCPNELMNQGANRELKYLIENLSLLDHLLRNRVATCSK
jgi:hypothetical protein